MPKRTCPLDDWSMLPQIKFHISQKEVDIGVDSDRYMKSVYDKTMMRLLTGGKKQITNNIDSSHTGGDVLKQTKCPGCFRHHINSQSQCNYCEKVYCTSCVYICKDCEGQFCTLCCMHQYNSRYDFTLCLNCVK